MPQFALLLSHAPDRYRDVEPDEMAALMSDYVSWVEKLTEEGMFDGGYKLADETGKTLVATADGVHEHDGPFAEMAEVLGGIMVINARDMAHAVEIARTNPHMKHNKRLEIRLVHDV